MKAKIALTALVCLGLTSCGGSGESSSPSESPPEKLQVVAFEGLHVPGTPEAAKADGFTNCTKEYSNFTCTRDSAYSLYGVPAVKAFVQLNSADSFAPDYYSPSSSDVAEAPANELSYRHISLAFPVISYDEQCVKKNSSPDDLVAPDECIIPGGIDTVKEQLAKNGWLADDGGAKVQNYYKPGTPIELSIRRALDFTSELQIAPISSKAASKKWQELQARTAKEQSATESADNFIESMKSK